MYVCLRNFLSGWFRIYTHRRKDLLNDERTQALIVELFGHASSDVFGVFIAKDKKIAISKRHAVA